MVDGIIAMNTSAADDQPWTWGWFRTAEGEAPVLIWIALIHVLAVVGIILFPLPSWEIAVGAFALMFFGGLGTTVAYHRALAHKALRLNPVVEGILTFFAVFNGSGSPGTWMANHRRHHATVETREDISSPRIGGFWWSHLRWLWQAKQSPLDRWAPDALVPRFQFWRKIHVLVLLLSLCGGLALGWEAFFWLGAIRLVYALHAQCFVNSIAHMRKGIAAGEDSSQNIGWLGLIHAFQGENWHGNHHAWPNSARLGLTLKQVDVGWWLILALEKLGLATGVRRPALARANV